MKQGGLDRYHIQPCNAIQPIIKQGGRQVFVHRYAKFCWQGVQHEVLFVFVHKYIICVCAYAKFCWQGLQLEVSFVGLARTV